MFSRLFLFSGFSTLFFSLSEMSRHSAVGFFDLSSNCWQTGIRSLIELYDSGASNFCVGLPGWGRGVDAEGVRSICWQTGIRVEVGLNGSDFTDGLDVGDGLLTDVVPAGDFVSVEALGLRTGMFKPYITFLGHSCSHLRQLRHFEGSIYAKKLSTWMASKAHTFTHF